KFDDVVFHYLRDGHLCTRLLQAKHFTGQNKEITVEELLGGKRFDLKKYFESYMQIRVKFTGKLELILCTNIGLKFEQISNTPRLLGRDSRRYRNVNIYFEPIPDDDILEGEKFRLVSEQYGMERGDVVRKLTAHFGASAADVEEF